MDSGHGNMRMNVESDRLSSLPDDLLHRIFSVLDITNCIESSVLSSRWRFVWTTMPYLNFSSDGFSRLPKFSKFVRNVMSRRNNQTEVYSVDLKFRGKANQVNLKRIMNYAFPDNIQQLNVDCLLENDTEFPLSLFSSQSLKHLSLRMQTGKLSNWCIEFGHLTSTCELPALTTLDLHCFTLCDDNVDIFSKCANLKSLALNIFCVVGSNDFRISHPRLSDLKLISYFGRKAVNVAAPQLKNLTIRDCKAAVVVSAPNLVSLIYQGCRHLNLSTDGFHSLQMADICVYRPEEADAHQILRALDMLHNVNSLTLNLEIFEFLSSYGGLLLHQPSPFMNLKSLKIYPEIVDLQALKEVVISTEFKSYLLNNSPGCAFTIVLREEIIAQKVMAELRVLLVNEKDDTKTNSAHLERGKEPVKIYEPDTNIKQKNEGNMAHLKSCWENLGVQLKLRRKKACDIISKLQHVEELLIKLPASRRAKIQPCFSSLCAEADNVIGNITDCMKIECDENQSRARACFHKLATTWDMSS